MSRCAHICLMADYNQWMNAKVYAAAASLAWSLGWAIAGPWYSLLQATLGFTAGYAINFATIIVLYSLGTFLVWWWFRAGDAGAGGTRAAARA